MTFDDFAIFVRAWAFVPEREQVLPETQFERDLGITGDDGGDLLIATERKFAVELSSEEDGYRKTLGLGPNEYLFNSEGFGVVSAVLTLFTAPSVRAFTVGELYEAVNRALEAK